MSKREQDHDTLGNRLKMFEALSTSRRLMPNTPVYARIDGRAFHTFCRGLEKPYSKDFIEVMQETCKYLVKETTAVLGYVQSDEISLGWTDTQHSPFDGRVQKLESVLASMASSSFVNYIWKRHINGNFMKGEYTRIWERMAHMSLLPAFDCRVFNVPTMAELANCFLWRENDAIKNSISGMALNFYSHKELQNKNSDEKIHMMRMKGYCFYEDTDPAFMRGTFYHRENYLKDLTDDEVAKIPENLRGGLITEDDDSAHTMMRQGDGSWFTLKPDTYYCWRSHIVPMNFPYRLTETADLEKVLFSGLAPECKIENPTFTLKRD